MYGALWQGEERDQTKRNQNNVMWGQTWAQEGHQREVHITELEG
jgi:hypothetical protein